MFFLHNISVNTPGILPTRYGFEGTDNILHGGINFRDAI